jgi:NAD(P)-dependent dehydrogenase (short-subunit alcohol dehydrogenase family)
MTVEERSGNRVRNLALLDNKVCIVLGAASLRSIGYATAELFASHGAQLVVVDVAMDDDVAARIAASIEDRTGCRPALIGVKCDITSQVECDDAVEAAVARFGRIDCLVNSAALVEAKSLLSITDESYEKILNVNLKGAFNFCRSVLTVFEKQGVGNIINIASVAAQRGGGLVGGAHYAASKGGMISLTRSIAREFGDAGVRANSICPSMTETGMLDGMSREQFDSIVSSIPLKRAGRPQDIAGACLFLASELSAYVTGATIDVNGGSHIH